MDFLIDDLNNENVGVDSSIKALPPWRVLIVDDDDQMHQITRLAVSDFSYEGKKLELISAFSAREAQQILQDNNDIALAIIDVVMESDHSGLALIEYIRNELKNTMIRLVLRTGQAGMAPEEVVIKAYEIDDYRLKTELTSEKLRTVLYSKLRAYSRLCDIKAQSVALEKTIHASSQVQMTHTLRDFSGILLDQAQQLLSIECSAIYGVIFTESPEPNMGYRAFILQDSYKQAHTSDQLEIFPPQIAKRCKEAFRTSNPCVYSDAAVFVSKNELGASCILYLQTRGRLTDFETHLMNVLGQNAVLTLQNISLTIEVQDTSKELVYNLANAVEARSKETGAHVQRVSIICKRLAHYYGLSDREVMLIKYGSPLHDIGKVAVSDRILHKPGKLDADEWAEMQRHVEYGVEILSKSNNPVMMKANEIARTHHEKWDGTGYPHGLSGTDIPIAGRIAAVADVFDALGSKRSYKKAWDDKDIMHEMLALKGKHFDPDIVDLMLEHWAEFIQIRVLYPD